MLNFTSPSHSDDISYTHHSLTVMIQDILIDLIMLSANDTQQ